MRKATAYIEASLPIKHRVHPVHDARAESLIGELHELAEVVLLAPQVVGAQELAVEVVEARQRRFGVYDRLAPRRAKAQSKVGAFVDEWWHG